MHVRRPLLAAALLAACAAPRPAVSRFTTMEGMRLHYVDAGRGGALLLVHGWACDHTVWRRQVEDLAAGRRVLAVDLPGHGRSAGPKAPYTLDLFARSLGAVLDDARVRRAVLVGHGGGVAVARRFQRLYPWRAQALVAVDGPLRAGLDPGAARAAAARLRAPDYRARVEEAAERLLPRHFEADLREELKAVMLGTPQHVLAASLEAANDPSGWADPIRVPLLVVNAPSPLWTEDYEAFARGLAPRVEYRLLPGASHFLMLDRPQELRAVLEEFLAQG
jgi:pimeloyl-ACP methyl ester carboxylesterase